MGIWDIYGLNLLLLSFDFMRGPSIDHFFRSTVFLVRVWRVLAGIQGASPQKLAFLMSTPESIVLVIHLLV
jgi:hypothetical protein